MSRFPMLSSRLVLGLSAACLIGLVVQAQGQPGAGGRTNASTAPLPPMPPAPVDFRQLLAMRPAEREKVFATRSTQQTEVLRQKVREYEALSPANREARLCCLQLRLYLRPLMEVPLTNRLARLAAIPQPDRKLVEERLQFWDRLEPAVQREFLSNEWVLRYIFRPETAVASQPPKTSASEAGMEKGIEAWNRLPEEKRQEIVENFKLIFDYSERQRARVLEEFSDAEREQMRRTLETFERLPKAKRDRCVNGFEKFAELSVPEREQFLSNIKVWESMDATDRRAWRALVTRISAPKPPRPPGMNRGPNPPAPPAPAHNPNVAGTNPTSRLPADGGQ